MLSGSGESDSISLTVRNMPIRCQPIRCQPVLRQPILALLFAIALFFNPGGDAARSAGASPAQAGDNAREAGGGEASQQAGAAGIAATGAFGFELKEERRYVLGPEDALRPGESAFWRIRLEALEGGAEERRAVFVLEHSRDEFFSDAVSRGRALRVLIDAELTVNPYGFPVRLALREQEDAGGETESLSQVRETIYEFDGEQYQKRSRLSGREWTFDVPIANQENLDVASRIGLYLFLPSALRCLGEYNRGPLRSCAGIEPAFANPGLLSLVMPDIWEDDDADREVLFFQPSGVGTSPVGLMNINAWLRVERNPLTSLRRYYDHIRLALEEVAEVEVGTRTVRAWRLSVSGGLRDVWVDDQGRVLRSDIDPHPRTHRDRFIRLQFPSEY